MFSVIPNVVDADLLALVEEGFVSAEVRLDESCFVLRVLRELVPNPVFVELRMDEIPADEVSVPLDEVDFVLLPLFVHFFLLDQRDDLFELGVFELDA